jgi:hypothetical protein
VRRIPSVLCLAAVVVGCAQGASAPRKAQNPWLSSGSLTASDAVARDVAPQGSAEKVANTSNGSTPIEWLERWGAVDTHPNQVETRPHR